MEVNPNSYWDKVCARTKNDMTRSNDTDKRRHCPPEWPVKLLRFFVKKEYVEEIEGDMEEIFQNNLQQRSITQRDHAWKCFGASPILLRNISQTPSEIPIAMLQNYFKIAWRNLIKKTAYSAINILGLALGIACCFLIFIFVQDELSYDNYHAKGDRIFRLIHGEKTLDASTGRPYPFWVWGNAPVGARLGHEFPEIDKSVLRKVRHTTECRRQNLSGRRSFLHGLHSL